MDVLLASFGLIGPRQQRVIFPLVIIFAILAMCLRRVSSGGCQASWPAFVKISSKHFDYVQGEPRRMGIVTAVEPDDSALIYCIKRVIILPL
ncbi:hypothetical protein A9Q89_07095 [Gammaproteobacteria bacterium 53_120_T64]|nr:hypothetical protein A9Q89_07095 [Gammaproteobacteria bacterium 53_120_T64]